MSTTAERIGNLYGTLGSKGASGILVIATVSIEEIASFILFECPCNETHYYYGLFYLYGPAFLLFTLGFTIQPKFWKLMTGLLKRKRVSFEYLNHERERGWDRYEDILRTLLRCTFISIPPPLAWIVIGLLKGDFYACAMWPDHPSLTVIQNECPLTNLTSPHKVFPDIEPSYILPACVALDRNHNVDYSDCSSIIARNLRSHSHMLAWMCAAILTVGIFVFSVVYSMCSKLTYFHSQYVKLYQKAEERELKRLLEEKSLAEAKDQVEYFLSEQRKKEDWDTIATLKSSLNPASMAGENFIYSALDGWHREKEANKISRVEIRVTHSTTPLLQ